MLWSPSLGYRKGAGSFWLGSGRAAVISLVACHVQKFIGAFALGIDSETLAKPVAYWKSGLGKGSRN